MTDYFALLQLERQPFLDPEKVKERFLELSTSCHPDKVHGGSHEEKLQATEQFAELNRAQQLLSPTASRLRHLLELENSSPPADVEEVPRESVDLFIKSAQLCRQVDSFLEEKRRAASPMLKVQLFERGLEWIDSLQELQKSLQSRHAQLDELLRGLNPIWEQNAHTGKSERRSTLPLKRLEEYYRLASFLARSSRQMEERLVNLSM